MLYLIKKFNWLTENIFRSLNQSRQEDEKGDKVLQEQVGGVQQTGNWDQIWEKIYFWIIIFWDHLTLPLSFIQSKNYHELHDVITVHCVKVLLQQKE